MHEIIKTESRKNKTRNNLFRKIKQNLGKNKTVLFKIMVYENTVVNNEINVN